MERLGFPPISVVGHDRGAYRLALDHPSRVDRLLTVLDVLPAESGWEQADAKFARIAAALGEPVAGLSPTDAAQRGVDAIRTLSRDVGLPPGLRAVGVPEDAFESFVDGTLSAARLIDNNPRRPTRDAVLAAYRASF